MAFSVAVNCPPLSREGIAGLVAEVSGDRVLSLTAVWLQIQPEVEASESDLPTFAACYPLMQREHGFMILAPRLPEVVECVSSLGSSSSLDVVTWDATVDIVGTRGRSLGSRFVLGCGRSFSESPVESQSHLSERPFAAVCHQWVCPENPAPPRRFSWPKSGSLLATEGWTKTQCKSITLARSSKKTLRLHPRSLQPGPR